MNFFFLYLIQSALQHLSGIQPAHPASLFVYVCYFAAIE